MMKTRRIQVGLVLALMLISTSCSSIAGDANETEDQAAGMENPAAVYCEGLGYTLEPVERGGGMDADCIFPDGSRCSEWDFLSGRCGQPYTYCASVGGTLTEEANIGTCVFEDGSSCNEYQFFTGECAPGDIPGEAGADETPLEEQATELKSFVDTRDYLAAYLLDAYGIGYSDPWIELNLTPEDAGPSTTMRFVSGPLTIVMTAEAAAPYPPFYTITEVADITNGFHWEGTVSFEGVITETAVLPPASVLNEGQARNAIFDYLAATYSLAVPTGWVDEGYGDPENTTMVRVYTSGSWVVEVRFEPAAPLVPEYQVIVENVSEGVRWEGVITLRGEIGEIAFTS